MLRIGGLDVGQKSDHSVLTTLREDEGFDGEMWAAERITKLPLGLPFREQQRRLQPELDALDMLIIDSGGTGQGWAETITGAKLKKLVPAVIIAGTAKGKLVKGRVTVGKSYLISGLLNMIHTGWISVDPKCSCKDILRDEMAHFERTRNGRHFKMEAAKGHHDDAVMSCALAGFLARTFVRQ